MEAKVVRALSAAVTTLLRPLARLLLRNGIPYRTFSDIAKRVYVDVAMEEFGIPGRKQSKSRVTIITGLSRKEVLRVRRLPPPDDLGAVERYNRAARVIAGWVRDPRFQRESGRPMPQFWLRSRAVAGTTGGVGGRVAPAVGGLSARRFEVRGWW